MIAPVRIAAWSQDLASGALRASTVLAGAFCLCAGVAQAMPIAIENASFEDVTGLVASNEFHFGAPIGWDFYDPNGFVTGGPSPGRGDNGIFTGTLNDDGTYFDPHVLGGGSAPDGDQVAILFGFGNNAGSAGLGEYGLEQELSAVLTANTVYELTVEVGNIGSGDGFILDGFPGYRVELLAGGTVIASDDNSLTIDERVFELSTVSFTTGAAHAQLGQQLGIRLINPNPANPPPGDIEVDFDDVRLTATGVPEPASAALMLGGLFVALRRRRVRS